MTVKLQSPALGGHAASPPRLQWLRRILCVLLMLAGAAYIATSLDGNWQQLQASAFSLSLPGAAVLIGGVVGTLLLSAAYHVLILRDFQAHRVPPARVAHAYALGQIVRYVPGKVVGVLFQAGFLGAGVRPSILVAALLVQTVHDYAWTFAFCGPILWALLAGSPWPLLALPPAVLAMYAAHRSRLSQRLLARLPLGSHFLASSSHGNHRPKAQTLVQAMVWVPMLGGMWFAFAPLFGTHGSLLAGLLYLVAAVVSLAMVVVPSGLVVREAVFLWLGGLAMLPAEQLLFAALATRIGMTVAEILTAALLALLDLAERRTSDARP